MFNASLLHLLLGSCALWLVGLSPSLSQKKKSALICKDNVLLYVVQLHSDKLLVSRREQ